MRLAGWATRARAASSAMRGALTAFRRDSRVACQALPGKGREPQPPTGADMHLVMNTFNRMAATASIDTEKDEQIFNLSDYLRYCLTYSVPAEISVDQEVALLGSYLCLTAGFRGWQLDAPVSVQPELRDMPLRAHSICLVAQAVLSAWSPETPGRWALPVSLRTAHGRGIAMDLVLQPLSAQPPPRLQRVHAELKLLCQSMSQKDAQWSYRARRHVGSVNVAVDVLIR